MNGLPRRRVTRLCRLLVVAGVITVAAPIHGVDAEEAQLGGFSAVASAAGQRAILTVKNFSVVEEFLDGPGPVAQSTVEQQSGGTSFASLPYPGATAVQYPAFVALGTGETPPGYPFYVTADPGNPEKNVSDPSATYVLDVKADRESAKALAKLRPAPGDAAAAGSAAATSISQEGGKVVVSAESLTDGLTIGGALRIGSVHSKSTTTYAPAEGEPKTVTQLNVGGDVIDGLRFSLGPKGLAVNDNGVPLPASDGLAVLNEALKPAGLSIRFLEPEPISGGARAGALEVSATADVPGGGTALLKVRFGQASTSVVPTGGAALAPLPSEPVTIEPPQGEASEPAPVGSDGGESVGEGISPPAAPVLDGAALGFGSEGGLSADMAAAAGALSGSSGGPVGPVAEVSAPPDVGGVGTGGASGADGSTALAARSAGNRPGDPRSVDGVYTAIAWAAVGVFVFSLMWQQGARTWTS